MNFDSPLPLVYGVLAILLGLVVYVCVSYAWHKVKGWFKKSTEAKR